MIEMNVSENTTKIHRTSSTSVKQFLCPDLEEPKSLRSIG